MNPGNSAVRNSIFAGRGGPPGVKLCAQFAGAREQDHRDRSYGNSIESMIAIRCDHAAKFKR
jgi:hypothetical protein